MRAASGSMPGLALCARFLPPVCDTMEIWELDHGWIRIRSFASDPSRNWRLDRDHVVGPDAFSDRLRTALPSGGHFTSTSLNPDVAEEKRLLDSGLRSLRVIPISGSTSPIVALCLASRQDEALAELPETEILPVTDAAALLLQGELANEANRESQRILEALGPLLETLASTLDLREVFAEISRAAQVILPHDFMGLDFFSPDRRTVQIHAFTAGELEDQREMPVTENLQRHAPSEYLIAEDTQHPIEGSTANVLIRSSLIPTPSWTEVPFDGVRLRVIRERGLRGAIRVPIRLDGAVLGGLDFASTQPGRYSEADAPLARWIAGCLALAIAHQRLAEEQKQAAEARERAARLEARVATLKQELESLGSVHQPVGRSRPWQTCVAQAMKVATTEANVFLSGESGTGKEVLARLIHRASPRAGDAFVALNCAALPEHLLESELFGHEKGAFTGAVTARPGRIEQAAGGVLFLDEVGEMSPAVQAKFLRVLQEREFQRLGGAKTLKADVRIIAATNRDLRKAMERGEFRPDLYYRLHVFEIRLPALRERPDDILPLIEHFLAQIGAEVGRPAAGVSREARTKLLAHPWPGNVRELRNALERAVILCDGGLINTEHLPIALESAAPSSEPSAAGSASESAAGRETTPPATQFTLPPEGIDLDGVERQLVVKALERAGNNKSKAARLLGLTRAQLYTRIEKHGLQ